MWSSQRKRSNRESCCISTSDRFRFRLRRLKAHWLQLGRFQRWSDFIKWKRRSGDCDISWNGMELQENQLTSLWLTGPPHLRGSSDNTSIALHSGWWLLSEMFWIFFLPIVFFCWSKPRLKSRDSQPSRGFRLFTRPDSKLLCMNHSHGKINKTKGREGSPEFPFKIRLAVTS